MLDNEAIVRLQIPVIFKATFLKILTSYIEIMCVESFLIVTRNVFFSLRKIKASLRFYLTVIKKPTFKYSKYKSK